MYSGVPPVPDPAFQKRLKEFDPKLKCEFDRGLELFVIVKERAVGGPAIVWVVCDAGMGFRQPDDRDIKHLFEGDLWRHGGVKERIRKGEEYMLGYQEKQDKEISQTFKEKTADDKYWLRRTLRKAANDGKAASEFRPITVKQKGYTVNDLRKLSSAKPVHDAQPAAAA